jgi:S1-C subfamily serine protease
VRLGKVFADSPAAVAGMRTGDVLKSIDGKSVSSLRELQGILAEREPGDEVELTFSHRGENRTRKLKLARLADVVPNQE